MHEHRKFSIPILRRARIAEVSSRTPIRGGLRFHRTTPAGNFAVFLPSHISLPCAAHQYLEAPSRCPPRADRSSFLSLRGVRPARLAAESAEAFPYVLSLHPHPPRPRCHIGRQGRSSDHPQFRLRVGHADRSVRPILRQFPPRHVRQTNQAPVRPVLRNVLDPAERALECADAPSAHFA